MDRTENTPAAGSGTAGAVPLDPELAAVLAASGARSREPLTLRNLAGRQAVDAAARPLPSLPELSRDGAFAVEEVRVPGPPGAPEVTLVHARPAGARGPLPLLYYMHGGGLVMGNARAVLPRVLASWAGPLGLAVVSVAYRLAPAARYPAAVEDCRAGLEWVAEHAGRLGVDADRIVIGGKSAGGGLTAALALLLRDRGGPRAVGQLLLSPMLDDRPTRDDRSVPDGRSVPDDRAGAHSARLQDGVDTLDRVSNATVWQAYLGGAYGSGDVEPYAAPARAADLSGLPPAYLDVGAAELFRDDAVTYASRLWRAGGAAELHVWPGAYHGFDTFAPGAALSRAATAARTDWLRRTLDAGGRP
ncbi:alpha/beta hydrolase [Streptomyces sp. R302]|uniref:alpha/beta hydrolase n=1 Tax=unclassified Streptomyces TaxID=2593676 RepID=UPI00145E826C|nr:MULTISPECIES: alpha/beta hydrolase [unclassified Streptomyces]NML54701.1 alpha/beta hydrolase [Streptomyces sp. R301]NML82502.1 alpha/beta hydrolase [Streptomyces sp. R302]